MSCKYSLYVMDTVSVRHTVSYATHHMFFHMLSSCFSIFHFYAPHCASYVIPCVSISYIQLEYVFYE